MTAGSIMDVMNIQSFRDRLPSLPPHLCLMIRGAGLVCALHSTSLAQDMTGSCPVATRPIQKLVLTDGRGAYVEPMAFAQGPTSAILAGEPMYVWKRGEPDSTHGLLGAVLNGQEWRGLPRPPLEGVLTHIRMAPDSAGFDVVFALTDSTSVGRYEEKVISYWYGYTDGRRWTRLQRLPLPRGPMNARAATRLVRVGSDLMIAVPYGTEGREKVAVFTQYRTTWRMDTLAVREARYLALGVLQDTPMLLVVYPASDVNRDANSLWAFERVSNGWRPLGLVVRGGSNPVHDPTLSRDASGEMLSWLASDDRGALVLNAAAFRRNGTIGPTHVVARDVIHWDLVREAPQTQWVVDIRHDDSTRVLQLIVWQGNQPRIRDVIANPYLGLMMGASLRGSPAAIGPLLDRSDNDYPFVSGILRFIDRCSATVPEVP